MMQGRRWADRWIVDSAIARQLGNSNTLLEMMAWMRIASNSSRSFRVIRCTTKPFRTCCQIEIIDANIWLGTSFHYALTKYSPARNSQRQTVRNHQSQLNGPLRTQFACRNRSMCVWAHFPIVGVWCNTHSRRKSISNFNERSNQ